MNTHRFGEAKVNLDILSRKEVLALNVYAHMRLGHALGEIATLNKFMNQHDFYSVPPNLDYDRDPFIEDLDSVRIEPS
jgi:hypothetical protein